MAGNGQRSRSENTRSNTIRLLRLVAIADDGGESRIELVAAKPLVATASAVRRFDIMYVDDEKYRYSALAGKFEGRSKS